MMKQALLLIIVLFAGLLTAAAQDFVTRGKIEFEIKRNTKRWFTAEQRNRMSGTPDVDLSYRDLIFSGNQSIYLPGRAANPPAMFSTNAHIFVDLNKKRAVLKTRLIEEDYVYGDSLKKVKWKIENETRKIAGWDCRKAVGVIDDSIYVVAFYCPEIIPQGGPELFNGLPGMILGVAIPRYYTTWFATKIELANVDEAKIEPPTIKKSKQYSKKELADIIFKKYEDNGWWKDVTLEKVLQSLSTYTIQ